MKLKIVPIKEIIGPFGSIWGRVGFHLTLAIILPFVIQYFNNDYSWQSYLKILCLYSANDFVFTLGHMHIFYNLDLNYDWLKNTVKRTLFGVIFHSVFSALAFILIQLVTMSLLYGMSNSEIFVWLLEVWWIPVGLAALIIVFSTTIGFFQNWKKSLVEEEQMRTEMMAYKFDSLKGQINPSFLFENFHSLKDLILSNQKMAVNVIQKMSQLYRSVLETKDMELVSLEEEMHQVELYVELLELRYGKNLKVAIDIQPNTEDRVVPVAIQNVIELLLSKYSQSDMLREISLSRFDSYLIISSTCKVKELNDHNLLNLQQRYAFFTDLKIIMKSNESGVSISIPILKEEQ